MRYLKIKKNESRPAVIAEIAGSLAAGEVAVLSTDTIYGFSCAADNPAAIRRIYDLKRREARKPLIVLVSSRSMARRLAQISPSQAVILDKLWAPGARPTTVILGHRERLPRLITGDSDGLALRLPKSDFLIKIIKKINKPLVSTSLNISGQDNILDPTELPVHWPAASAQPDLVVDAGRPVRTRPSRLVDLRPKRPVVLRK